MSDRKTELLAKVKEADTAFVDALGVFVVAQDTLVEKYDERRRANEDLAHWMLTQETVGGLQISGQSDLTEDCGPSSSHSCGPDTESASATQDCHAAQEFSETCVVKR